MQFQLEERRGESQISRRSLLLGLVASAALIAGCSSASTSSPTIITTPQTPTPEPNHELLARYYSILPNSPASNLMKSRMAELFSGPQMIQRGGIQFPLHGSLIQRNAGQDPRVFNGIATIRLSRSIADYQAYTVTQEGNVPVTLRTGLKDQEKAQFAQYVNADGNIVAGNVGFRVGSIFAEGYYPNIITTIPVLQDVKFMDQMLTYLLVKEGFSLMLIDQMIEIAFQEAAKNKSNYQIQTSQGPKEALVQAFSVLFENGYAGQQNISGPAGTRLMAAADLGGLALAAKELTNTDLGDLYKKFSLIKKAQDKVAGFDFGTTLIQIYDNTMAWCLANYEPTTYWVPQEGGEPFFKGNFGRLP